MVVLDRRLPARLNELSDRPEGSLPFLTRPDEDLIGTIINGNEKVEIIVQRVAYDKNGPLWLFSTKTLSAIPDLFADVTAVSGEHRLPPFLVHTRVLHLALVHWLAIFLASHSST